MEPRSMKESVGEPGGLGLFGLAIVTLLAGSEKVGLTSGVNMILPWAIFLGASAQFIACLHDFRRRNVFGATAFGAFALFWYAVSLLWVMQSGSLGQAIATGMDTRQLGLVFVGYWIFGIYMAIAATETNRILFSILCLIVVFFTALGLSTFGVAPMPLYRTAGVVELAISLLGFYASAATVLNTHFGREFLPVGKPFKRLKSHDD